MKKNHEGFCTLCGEKIKSFAGLASCPRCGDKGVPCSYENQVDISINTHELRLLCIWAENWGHQIGSVDVVYAIAARIRKQLSPKISLTMADEFQQLKDAGVEFETNHKSGALP